MIGADRARRGQRIPWFLLALGTLLLPACARQHRAHGAASPPDLGQRAVVAEVGSPDELTLRNIENLLARHGIPAGRGAYSLVAAVTVPRDQARRAVALLESHADIREHAMSVGRRSWARTTTPATAVVGGWLAGDPWPPGLPPAPLLREAARGRSLPILMGGDLWIHEVEWEARVFVGMDGSETPAYDVDLLASRTRDGRPTSHRRQLWVEDGRVHLDFMAAEDCRARGAGPPTVSTRRGRPWERQGRRGS
jgi:hypothetical protein